MGTQHFAILNKRKTFKCFKAFLAWKKCIKEKNEVVSSGFKAYKSKGGGIYFRAYVFGYVGRMRHNK